MRFCDPRCTRSQASALQGVGFHAGPRGKSPHPVLANRSLPNPVHAKGVEDVHFCSPDRHPRHATVDRDGQDNLRRTVVGADLDPRPRGNELPALDRIAERLRACIVVPVGDIEMEEAFFMDQRPIIGDLIDGLPPSRSGPGQHLRQTHARGHRVRCNAACCWRCQRNRPRLPR